MYQTLLFLLMLVGLGYAMLRGMDALKGKAPQKIYIDCQCVSTGQERNGGSGCLEVVLWLTFVGGLVYSVWRRTSGASVVCPSCGGKLIGLETPRGQTLWRQAHQHDDQVGLQRDRFERARRLQQNKQDDGDDP